MASNLNLASNVPIAAALSNLRHSYNGRNAWLDPAINKYVIDTISKIEYDLRPGQALDSPAIVDYLATSVFLHCFNGWTYLSNAVNSLLEGDFGNAIHNAYYAELRSIFSVLASQGIGVFNKSNVLVDNLGNAIKVTPANQPTHVFAKSAFDEWLKSPGNSNLLLGSISIDSQPLSEWISHTGFSSFLSSELASDKLKQWSLDLSVINNESRFRNFVSYNPIRYDLNDVYAHDISVRLSFIKDLWQLCGPNDLFSYSILRTSYELLYKTFPIDLKDLDMVTDWTRIFSDLGKNINDQRSQQIVKFLRRDINTTDNLVFQYANSIKPSTPFLESDIDPLGIISRAAIMLLINTKMAESLLRQTGTARSDLNFWFNNIGLKAGFWKSMTEPDAFSDLWSDIEFEIEDVDNWMASGIDKNPHSFRTTLNGSILNMRNFGRAYLFNTGF